jgi:hypothetical protein
MKALHPADQLTEVRGIPDQSSCPSVFQNFQFTTNVVNPTPAVTGNWSFDMFILPNPVIPGSTLITASDGTYYWAPITNTGIGVSGTNCFHRQQVYVNAVEKYRLAYLGVTGHLDAAAVTNQGMIAAAQYPLGFSTYNRLLTAAAPGQMMRPLDVFDEPPKLWEDLQSLPNAYLEEAKMGVYSQYKLTSTCQKWRRTRSMRCFIPYGNALAGTATTAVSLATFPANSPAMATVSDGYPYGLPGNFHGSPALEGMTFELCDTNVLHIAGRNLHQVSSMTFTLRMGFEEIVSAGSNLVSFAKISPRYDPVALDGYFMTAREMKDGYPESYNGLEKILPVIGSALSAALSFLPGGNLIKAGGTFLGKTLFPSLFSTPIGQLSGAQKEEATKAAGAPKPPKLRTGPKRIKL